MGGGTGPTGPVLAGPLSSNQVITFVRSYAVKRTVAARPLLLSRPDVRMLDFCTERERDLGGVQSIVRTMCSLAEPDWCSRTGCQ